MELPLTAERPGLARWFRWATYLFAAMIVIQAFLIGRGIFIDIDAVDLHARVGDITLLVAIAVAILALLMRVRGDYGRSLLILTVGLGLLTFLQLALGYQIESSDQAGAFHVPLGVLIFGIAIKLVTMAQDLEERLFAR